MSSGDLAPIQPPEPLPPAVANRRPYRISIRKLIAVGGSIATVVACGPNDEPRTSVEDGEVGGQLGVESIAEDFRDIVPPDCSPSSGNPSVQIEELPDDSLKVSGAPANAGEFSEADIYWMVTTARPGQAGEGYRTRLSQSPNLTATIPSDEVEGMKVSGGRYTTHLVALPEDYDLDTVGIHEGVTAQEIVYEAIKQHTGIEQPTEQEVADLITVLGTVTSQCSTTQFENGEWVQIIATPEDYAIANPRPEGVDAGRGGSEEIPSEAPQPSPSPSEESPGPETIYPDQIDGAIEELNSDAEHGLYSFNYSVGPAGEVAGIRVSIFMELTGLTPQDREYREKFEDLCHEAIQTAISAGIPEALTTCIGPNNIRHP